MMAFQKREIVSRSLKFWLLCASSPSASLSSSSCWGLIEDGTGAADFGQDFLGQGLPMAALGLIVVMFDELKNGLLRRVVNVSFEMRLDERCRPEER